jgi:predicted esterase
MRKHSLIILSLLACIPVLSKDGDPLGNQVVKRFTVSSSGASKWGLIHYPSDFYTSQKKYPIIVFNHGIGESGRGDTMLSALNRWGPGWFVANQAWNLTATSPLNGRPYEFLYVAMQDTTVTPTPEEMLYVINNEPAIKDRIDRNGIFITGISVGGGNTMKATLTSREMSASIAAIVPVSAALTFDFSNIELAKQMKIPVWAFHGLLDPVAPYQNTTEPYINALKAVNPGKTRWTQLPVRHTAWNTVYAPTYRETIDGKDMNMYEWMLYNMKNQEAVLATHIDSFSGAAAEGKTVLNWRTASESNNQKFVIERSEDGINFLPVGELPTKAPGGNSAQPILYTFTHLYK